MMPRKQDNSEPEGEGHPWRNGAISVALAGAIIAVMFYSAHSPARQESGVQPSSADAAPPAEVRDCIRVKRIEIVDERGGIVGVLQGVDQNKEAFAVLELVGQGTLAGKFVHIDPRRLVISGDRGATEFWATGVQWTATVPPGKDDVMVRIDANSDGGFVQVKSDDPIVPFGVSQQQSLPRDE
jgi:hypothetical protein